MNQHTSRLTSTGYDDYYSFQYDSDFDDPDFNELPDLIPAQVPDPVTQDHKQEFDTPYIRQMWDRARQDLGSKQAEAASVDFKDVAAKYFYRFPYEYFMLLFDANVHDIERLASIYMIPLTHDPNNILIPCIWNIVSQYLDLWPTILMLQDMVEKRIQRKPPVPRYVDPQEVQGNATPLELCYKLNCDWTDQLIPVLTRLFDPPCHRFACVYCATKNICPFTGPEQEYQMIAGNCLYEFPTYRFKVQFKDVKWVNNYTVQKLGTAIPGRLVPVWNLVNEYLDWERIFVCLQNFVKLNIDFGPKFDVHITIDFLQDTLTRLFGKIPKCNKFMCAYCAFDLACPHLGVTPLALFKKYHKMPKCDKVICEYCAFDIACPHVRMSSLVLKYQRIALFSSSF
jgi:hypothetical protein